MDKKQTYPLCPGKDYFLKDVNDLDAETSRRLVSRRARAIFNEADFPLIDNDETKGMTEIRIKEFYEKIHSKNNLLPAKYLDLGAKAADAVCRIVIRNPDGVIKGYGTGFKISDTLIMTNNHVLRSERDALESIAEFGYEEGETKIRITLNPEHTFITNADLDFTIVSCQADRIAHIKPIKLYLDPAIISVNEQVNIIQHPRARKKEIAIHDNNVIDLKDKVIHYRTDTEPGSSGSPVMNNDWRLVALHHAGWNDTPTSAINEGIRVSSIIRYLLNRFRIRRNSNPEIDEFLSTLPDTSSYHGFFDTYGLDYDTDLEKEVPDFKGTNDYADIGFWNIEHFNNNVNQRRIRDIAKVLNDLNMDIMGLTEVEEGALSRLKEEMAKDGNNTNFHVLDQRGRQDIAVLYDSDTSEVKFRDDLNDTYSHQLSARTRDNKTAFPREPLFAECKVKDGNNNEVHFMLMVVHLKAFGDAKSRARRKLASEMLAEIINDIRTNNDIPVILGGDFNEKLDNDVLKSIKDTPDLFALTADDATTSAMSYVGARHKSLIDHIIISRDIQAGDIDGDDAAIVRIDKSISNYTDKVSDHVPVLFRMIMNDTPAYPDPDVKEENVISIPIGSEKVKINFE